MVKSKDVGTTVRMSLGLHVFCFSSVVINLQLSVCVCALFDCCTACVHTVPTNIRPADGEDYEVREHKTVKKDAV